MFDQVFSISVCSTVTHNDALICQYGEFPHDTCMDEIGTRTSDSVATIVFYMKLVHSII